jgi:ribosomal-protein-alanine N-acetyltransferase
VGYAWLCHTQAGGKDEIELGYALLPEFWGKGLATEMAKATVAVGFEQLALPELVCFTLVTNEASQRVMEKAGFRYERDFVHVGLPHMFYRLTAAQWKEAMGEGD